MLLNLVTLIFIFPTITMFDIEHFAVLLDEAEEYIRMDNSDRLEPESWKCEELDEMSDKDECQIWRGLADTVLAPIQKWHQVKEMAQMVANRETLCDHPPGEVCDRNERIVEKTRELALKTLHYHIVFQEYDPNRASYSDNSDNDEDNNRLITRIDLITAIKMVEHTHKKLFGARNGKIWAENDDNMVINGDIGVENVQNHVENDENRLENGEDYVENGENDAARENENGEILIINDGYRVEHPEIPPISKYFCADDNYVKQMQEWDNWLEREREDQRELDGLLNSLNNLD